MASFPEEIPGDDLIRAFTLTGADRDLVAIRRGAANRLRLALQLCALRYLGFVPRNLSAAPRSAACFVADQLEVTTDEIQSYARREQTRFTALHRGSGTPRLLDAPVTGLGRTRSLAGSNGPLSTMLRRFSFASLVSGGAPRGSSFQHPTESYDLSVRRHLAPRKSSLRRSRHVPHPQLSVDFSAIRGSPDPRSLAGTQRAPRSTRQLDGGSHPTSR